MAKPTKRRTSAKRRTPANPAATNSAAANPAAANPAATTGACPRTTQANVRDRLLADFATLKVPLTAEQLDAVLARADRDRLTHLEFTLADQTLPQRVRYYARFDLLIIDEFGFDKIERTETPQAANLLYKIIDARTQRSTALVTNIDFDAWGDYLGDPPLAMAFLDRVVDGAIILKINGRSYRAHRAGTKKTTAR